MEQARDETGANAADPLLNLLTTLTRLYHRPLSAESLVAGLPLVNGRMDPSLFIRAAERAGFRSEERERKLDEITAELLPVVLLLEDGNAALLVSKVGDQLNVVFPDDPATHVITPGAMAQRYSGNCLLFADAANEPTGKTHWFWQTIKRSRGIYAEVLVASLLVNLFALATPLFIMNVYDRVVPNQAYETLWVLASGVAIVFIFDLVMKTLRGYFIDTAGKRSDIILSADTFARVMDIKLAARPGRIGSFANNLQEFDTFREFFTSTTLITVIDLPFVLLFVLLIYSIGGHLALIPLVAIPFIVITGVLLQPRLQTLIGQTFNESARKHAMLIETLSNLDTVKGSRAEGVMQRRWETFNARIARLSLKSRFLSLVIVNLAQICQQLATVAVVILGVYAIVDGNLSVGGLIACTILVGRCLAPMAQVASILTRWHHSMTAFKTIDNLMQLPQERPADRRFLHRPTLNGEIEFRNVTFTYPGQAKPALNDVSFRIAPGERVAVIGKTGSGKTTVERLLMKFFDPASGSILIGGTDITQLDPSELRGQIAYVPQEITLFDGTVRDNITLSAPGAPDADVVKAAETAGIASFLNEHPEGYDLAVGERGGRLSGGQRQAIAIARALITETGMVVMDEPSNAMDNATEITFIRNLREQLGDKTLLLVTHKSSMLGLVDRLLVLNDGQLVADGPREDVLRLLREGNT